MVGDNLAIIKYAASQGRLRHPSMQLVLDSPLKELVMTGWETCWFAVRSKVNSAAHTCANDALLHAHSLHLQNSFEPEFSFCEFPAAHAHD
eukprot:1897139-Heterocapsa_arctica.AAC.1